MPEPNVDADRQSITTTETTETTEVRIAYRAEFVTEDALNQITETIIGAAIAVHRELGPGLLESAYEACLVYELLERGLHVEQQKPLPLVYRGMRLDCGYRLDLLVESCVVVEVKAVERLERIHDAQLLSYLKLSGHKLGLLINFNVRHLVSGVRRLANGHL